GLPFPALGGALAREYQFFDEFRSDFPFRRTLRARGTGGMELVIRLYHVVQRPDTEGLLDQLRYEAGPRLGQLLALPPTLGLAPWLPVVFLPGRHCLLLVRRFYGTKRAEAFPPTRTAGPGGAPCPEFLTALSEIARGIDTLYGHCGGTFRCP